MRELRREREREKGWSWKTNLHSTIIEKGRCQTIKSTPPQKKNNPYSQSSITQTPEIKFLNMRM